MNKRLLFLTLSFIIIFIFSACSIFGVGVEKSSLETSESETEITADFTPTPRPSATPSPKPEWKFFKNEILQRNDDNKRLVIDQDGLVWFTGFGGVRTWDPETNDYGIWNLLEDGSESTLRELMIDKKGVIWTASEDQLFSFTGEDWESFNAPFSGEFVWGMQAGTEDDIWVCAGDGVHQFDGVTWESYGSKQGLMDDSCYAIAMDPDDHPWVVSAKNSLSHYENGWQNYVIDEKYINLSDGDLIDTAFANLHVGPGGEVWVMGMREVVRWDRDGWFFDIVQEGDGRLDAFGLGIHGEPWVSYFKDGASYFLAFDGEVWQSMMSGSLENGIQNRTFNTILTAPNNAMWFLGEDVFIRKMLYDETIYLDAQGAWNPYQNKGFDFSGVNEGADLFYLSSEGILEIDSGSRDVSVHQGAGALFSNDILAMDVDSMGGVWTLHRKINDDTTLARFNGEASDVYPGSDIKDFFIASDDTLWIKQWGFGNPRLYKLTPDWENLEQVGESDGLLTDEPITFSEDPQGNIWIGHYENNDKIKKNGVSMWDGENWFAYSGGQSGVPLGGIVRFVLSPEGILWSKSCSSISCYLYFNQGDQWVKFSQVPNCVNYWCFNRWGNPVIRVWDDLDYLGEFNPESSDWEEITLPEVNVSAVGYFNNTLWIGTLDDGLYYRIDSEDGKGEVQHIDLDSLFGVEEINVITSGLNHEIWMGTSGGVYLFSEMEVAGAFVVASLENGIWQAFEGDEAAGFVDVKFIEVAPDGSIWFGSSTQGIARYGLP